MSRIIGLLTILSCLLLALTAQADIVINEIMYNSPGSPDVEWVELYNNGSTTVELDDYYLVDSDTSHPHCLLMGDLPAGEYLVVVGDFSLFSNRYPTVSNININAFDPSGTGFGLGNGGDTVQLFDDDGFLADAVAYDDGGAWPGSADGGGPSIELINPFLNNQVATSWDPSAVEGGTPGQINSVYVDNQAPVIHDTDRSPKLPQVGEGVLITAEVTDATALDRVELFVDLGAGFVSQLMYDDGAHGDGAAADSLFGAIIESQPEGNVIRYYVAAYDDIGQVVTKPSDAPTGFHAYTVGYTPNYSLRINEAMAANATTLADEMSEFDDWLEIYNNSESAMDLEGMFLTDNLGAHRKWELPAVTIPGGGFIIVWLDDDITQGPLHASFKLSAGGEEIALYDSEEHGNTLLHGFKFGIQNDDISLGILDWAQTGLPGQNRTQLVSLPEYFTSPTPGASNEYNVYPVAINEFLTTSNSGGVDDWIELVNRSEQAVDISGWGLSDDSGNVLKWVFPLGTILDPGELIVVDEMELGYSLSSAGEEIQLTLADGLTGIDYISFDEQQADVSFGRVDNTSLWTSFETPTPWETNPSGPSPVNESILPLALNVQGAHPNPFNPMTQIRFELPRTTHVSVGIYSLNGRLVRNIDAGVMQAGSGQVLFNGRDNEGRALASGIFFAKVNAGVESAIVKMTLVK
ncbi:MAG: hypothetical protein GY780_16825 [bacterium]|nr:hypothetical protein [bacterium]